MGISYILTVILLGIGFIAFKKSEKELNLVKWIAIFIVGILAYNITICMLLGILNIKQNIWLLAIINAVIGGLLLYKPIKHKECQKYKCSKLDIFMIVAILIMCSVMFVKDLYIHKGDVTHVAIDSAIHYRAAKHYSENLELFIYTEDKTFFDFNIMQTGAYINDGILMNVINDITGLDHIYIYQLFDSVVLFLGVFALYASIADRIKTKRGAVLSLMLLGLYLYGYPYNSWVFGFSYLNVGITIAALIPAIVDMFFNEENINKTLVTIMTVMVAMGLIFSYCLFVPGVFASICIYLFVMELKSKDSKKYLKIFGKNTLIVTGLLLLVTAFGIGYLFIPSFIIEGQKDLVSALKDDGGIYMEKYREIAIYAPFAILYVVDLIKRLKNKDINYLDFFSIGIVGLFVVFYAAHILGMISLYYMAKLYFILWIVIFALTIDLVNKFIDTKILKWIIPIFVIGWTTFVCSWVWIKAGHILGEEEKHALPNYVGIYYIENCERRKAYDMIYNFNEGNIALTRFAREELTDMTADNTVLFTESFNRTIWAEATLEYTSDKTDFRHILNMTNQFNIKDSVADPDLKYMIKLTSEEDHQIQGCKDALEELEKYPNVEVLLSNENGFVARINR